MKFKQRYWVGVIFSLCVAFFVSPVPAYAVPLTLSTLPNSSFDVATAAVVIEFNEPIVLLAQTGKSIEVGELTAVTQDNPIQAEFSPLSAAARWLTLTGISLLMGLFAFRLLVWNPVLAEEELTAEEEAVDLAHAQTGVKIGMGGLALIAIGLLLIFLDQNQLYNLLQFEHFQTWIGSQFGLMWLAQFFLIAIAHFNLSLFVNVKSGHQELRGWEWWAGLFLAMGLALTNALMSHSAALQSDTLTAVFVDWIHVVAATMWVGGLLFLAVGLWQARILAAEQRSWLNLSLFLNFSALAAIAVGFLIASGLYLSWQHVGSWTALVGTAYGVVLLAKLAIVTIIFIIAGVNLFIVKPKLQAAYENPDEASAAKAMSQFMLLTRAAMILAFMVLLAVGILTNLQPGIYDTFAPFRLENGGSFQLLERFAKFMTLAGNGGTGAALVLFAILWGFITTRAARSEWHLLPLILISLIAFWIGTRQLIEFFDVEYTPAKFTTNPILPDAESVAIGQQLFTQNCASCHGGLGVGDGPAAATLPSSPADFTDGHAATHTDGDIYYWVLEGVEGTAMPAFGDQFEREEVWHLVNYVRRLSAGGG